MDYLFYFLLGCSQGVLITMAAIGKRKVSGVEAAQRDTIVTLLGIIGRYSDMIGRHSDRALEEAKAIHKIHTFEYNRQQQEIMDELFKDDGKAD